MPEELSSSLPINPEVISGELGLDKKTLETRMKAVRFSDLVEAGSTPKEAAKEMHTTLAKLERIPAIKRKIAHLIADYGGFPEDLDREIIRAKRRQFALDDEQDPKVQLEALKQMASDPRLEMSGGKPLVEINLAHEPNPDLADWLSQIIPTEDASK